MKIHYAKEGFKAENIKESISVIVGRNGYFKNIVTEVYSISSKITAEEFSEISGSNYIDVETCGLLTLPKVDKETYEQSLTFFKEVFEKYKGESCILLALKRGIDPKKQKYKIVVPEQQVSGGHVDYSDGMKAAHDELEKDEYFVGSIHTHPDFGAFQSSVDLSDEKDFDGIHVTLGYINKDEVEYHQRFVLAGITKTCETIFCPSYQLKKPVDIPPEWMDKVSALVTHTTTTRLQRRTVKSMMVRFGIFRFNKADCKELVPMFSAEHLSQ